MSIVIVTFRGAPQVNQEAIKQEEELDARIEAKIKGTAQGWSNPIARRPGLPIFGVGQVKNYRQHAHGQVYFMVSLVQSWCLLSE